MMDDWLFWSLVILGLAVAYLLFWVVFIRPRQIAERASRQQKTHRTRGAVDDLLRSRGIDPGCVSLTAGRSDEVDPASGAQQAAETEEALTRLRRNTKTP